MPARSTYRWSGWPSFASDRSSRGRIGTALIYPAIVSTIAVFSSIFLMTFVVPRILEPLIEQGLPLPFPTRVVKGAERFSAGVVVAARGRWWCCG